MSLVDWPSIEVTMNQTEMLYILSNMKLSEHKVMQKALRLLMSVGIDQLNALSIILDGMKQKHERNEQFRIARVK